MVARHRSSVQTIVVVPSSYSTSSWRKERDTVAVDVRPSTPAQTSAEPTVAENGAEHVPAPKDQGGDVVGLVPKPMRVARPAGSEHLVADDDAVEVRLVNAERGRVESRTSNRPLTDELAAEEWGRPIGQIGVVPGRRHELRVPVVAVQQPSFDLERVAPRTPIAVTAARPHFDLHSLAGAERCERPGNQHRLG